MTITQETVTKAKTEDNTEYQDQVPELFVDGADPRDLVQGQVNNFWLMQNLGAISAVDGKSYIEDIFVIPTKTENEDDMGVYGVKLWLRGRRVLVLIDDFIPVDENGSPVFLSTYTPNEMWPWLLEKAIAKLEGCYGNLANDRCYSGVQGSMDLMCGLNSTLLHWGSPGSQNLKAIAKVPNLLLDGSFRNLAMSLSVCDPINEEKKAELFRYGIVSSQGYSALDYKVMKGKQFVKCRNTWGNVPYKGPWSDVSDMWTKFPELKVLLRPVTRSDGIFWMELKDFLGCFKEVLVQGR